MGIVKETAQFMYEAAQQGVHFGHTLTLGRQDLYIDHAFIKTLTPQRLPDPSVLAAEPSADTFIKTFLGAATVTSLDMTDFEGADMQHDLNEPIAPAFHQAYDTVIDGGTLEHIFNFPVAIANCMKILTVGGRLFLFTNANNFMGHGLYQFSPELFYRVLSQDYGFAVERMVALEYKYIAAERGSYRRQYQVHDPAAVGSRITLVNARPLGLMIQATKLRHDDQLFARAPQQSDYVKKWQGQQRAATGVVSPPPLLYRMVKGRLRPLYRVLPKNVQIMISVHYKNWKIHSLRNQRFFRVLR